MKILIIEDEFELLKSIKTFMEAEDFVVETATTYQQAMEKVMIYDYDCILLDISLPGGSGLNILSELKKNNMKTNIIIVSAKNSLDDRINGLDLGADDYLTKPFHLTELHARIKAIVRRKLMDGDQILKLGNLELDYQSHKVKIGEEELKLNRKEYDILLFFCTNINRVITKESLAEHVWGDNIDMVDSFDFIYSQVKNLRKKLKDKKADIEINNIYGVGYKVTQ